MLRMGKDRFSALLSLIIPQVVALIEENYPYDEVMATEKFYRSKVYASLEDETTGLWHFSPLTLFNMFDEEQSTGSFTFPEEA